VCFSYQKYTARRDELSQCGLGDWHAKLMKRAFELSEDPYIEYLCATGISRDTQSWWITEFDGWSGGDSHSARTIDVQKRVLPKDGFHPINADFESTLTTLPQVNKDAETGMIIFESWADYYAMRSLSMNSPVALLLTFPLTLYYAIQQFGKVPVTVSRMLKRSLRLHIVGAEKELNLIDLFEETVSLMPNDICLELIFVIREDMRPTLGLREEQDKCLISISNRLCVTVQVGTYAETLDPRFDISGGLPDMVIAFNAGLYAYDSWRSVVRFLEENTGVVGVFTDYNEFSAVQCASLGGHTTRQSVKVNPFRQPRCMPVYSMNLPQFSNGFMYVFNQQDLTC